MLSLCLFLSLCYNKSHYFLLTPRNGKFLIKLLLLSHLYNNYIWAGESWTFTSVDSNVRCEREKSHPTVDLSPADNGHYCYNIYASIRVWVKFLNHVQLGTVKAKIFFQEMRNKKYLFWKTFIPAFKRTQLYQDTPSGSVFIPYWKGEPPRRERPWWKGKSI